MRADTEVDLAFLARKLAKRAVAACHNADRVRDRNVDAATWNRREEDVAETVEHFLRTHVTLLRDHLWDAARKGEADRVIGALQAEDLEMVRLRDALEGL